jgi:hypothetical protein
MSLLVHILLLSGFRCREKLVVASAVYSVVSVPIVLDSSLNITRTSFETGQLKRTEIMPINSALETAAPWETTIMIQKKEQDQALDAMTAKALDWTRRVNDTVPSRTTYVTPMQVRKMCSNDWLIIFLPNVPFRYRTYSIPLLCREGLLDQLVISSEGYLISAEGCLMSSQGF